MGYVENIIINCERKDCEGFIKKIKGCHYTPCLKRKIDKCESLVNKEQSLTGNYFHCEYKAKYKLSSGKYVCKIHANEFDKIMKRMNKKERAELINE
jgi:hypothetical protein